MPTKENDLLVWHDRYHQAAVDHGTAVGLTAADIANITADNEDLHATITDSAAKDAAAKTATATKKTTIRRVVTNARGCAGRIKTHAGYDEAMGNTFGIIGAEDTTDLSTSKPTLTARAQGGGVVELGFNKSISDGVNLYCQRDGEGQMAFLARDTSSPYVDTRPLLAAGKPERREYRARYVVADQEVGEFSDELVVTVAP